MSIEEIKARIIELRVMPLEDSEEALENLRGDLYPLGFSVCWSDAQRDYVLFVRY